MPEAKNKKEEEGTLELLELEVDLTTLIREAANSIADAQDSSLAAARHMKRRGIELPKRNHKALTDFGEFMDSFQKEVKAESEESVDPEKWDRLALLCARLSSSFIINGPSLRQWDRTSEDWYISSYASAKVAEYIRVLERKVEKEQEESKWVN